MKLQIDKEVKKMADFTKMTKYIDNLSGELDIPGADVAVYRNNECIYRHAEGYSDAAKTKPMNGKEQFFLYSASKVITMTAMMILIEEGKVSLDDEAGKFYPAFYDVCVKTPEGLKKAKNKMCRFENTPTSQTKSQAMQKAAKFWDEWQATNNQTKT